MAASTIQNANPVPTRSGALIESVRTARAMISLVSFVLPAQSVLILMSNATASNRHEAPVLLEGDR